MFCIKKIIKIYIYKNDKDTCVIKNIFLIINVKFLNFHLLKFRNKYKILINEVSQNYKLDIF